MLYLDHSHCEVGLKETRWVSRYSVRGLPPSPDGRGELDPILGLCKDLLETVDPDRLWPLSVLFRLYPNVGSQLPSPPEELVAFSGTASFIDMDDSEDESSSYE